jgi:hypothetical protein
MNIDFYTKGVLTVIALALSAIALQNAIPSASAQAYNGRSGVQLVAICNPDGKACADINSDYQLRITSGR